MMRPFFMSCLIVATGGCATAGAVGVIETKQDEITKVSTRTIDKMYAARSDAGYLSEIRFFTIPATRFTNLTVYSENPCWSWVQCNTVDLVVDDVIYQGEGSHDGIVGTYTCLESLSIAVPETAWEQLQSAKSVKVRACNALSVLTPEQVAQVRELFSTGSR